MIEVIKNNLKELEDTIIAEHKKNPGKVDTKEIAAKIVELRDALPEVEKIAKLLKHKKDVDPYLNQMVVDLQEAINNEKLHHKITEAKLDFIN
jgi:Mg2+ and Co2+ transporter CorA